MIFITLLREVTDNFLFIKYRIKMLMLMLIAKDQNNKNQFHNNRKIFCKMKLDY